jgi:DNA-binding CsgD family transcriptional regulator
MIVLAETDRAEEARALFEAFADRHLAGLPRDSYWLTTIAILADVCALVGDRARAGVLYDLLSPYEGRNVSPGSSPFYFGAASHYLGLLATLLTRWEAAVGHFDAALDLNTRMNAVPFVAYTRYVYARMLLTRGAVDDRSRVEAMLTQAQATADELELVRLSADVGLLRERLPGRRSPAGGSAPERFGLSERELDVLRLLAERRSNPEIAEALFISRATVRTHVDNILGKLGVHSRAEAVDIARRHGLLAGVTALEA